MPGVQPDLHLSASLACNWSCLKTRSCLLTLETRERQYHGSYCAKRNMILQAASAPKERNRCNNLRANAHIFQIAKGRTTDYRRNSAEQMYCPCSPFGLQENRGTVNLSLGSERWQCPHLNIARPVAMEPAAVYGRLLEGPRSERMGFPWLLLGSCER